MPTEKGWCRKCHRLVKCTNGWRWTPYDEPCPRPLTQLRKVVCTDCWMTGEKARMQSSCKCKGPKMTVLDKCLRCHKPVYKVPRP